MSMFVMVTDDSGDRYAINIDRIAWISPESCNVCMSGMDGIMRLCPEDVRRLLDMVGVDANVER